MADDLVPALVRDRAGALRDVAEEREPEALRAPRDHPELHRRQVLGLVDDHVVERPGRLPDQRVRLVQELHVRVAPAPPATAQEPLLFGVQDAVGGLRQEPRGREERAHEALRRHRRPREVEHALQLAARPERPLDLLGVAERPTLEQPGVLAVEAADDPRAEPLARRGRRAVLGADLLHQALLVANADADEGVVETEEELVGRGAQEEAGGALEDLRHAIVPLQPRDVTVVGRAPLDAVDELGDRALLDGVLPERRQDVRDVLHERAVRPDDEHAAPRVPLPRRVEEPRGPVQADGGLAGPRPALDHERGVGVVRDQPVLVGLDRRDDVAHARVPAPLQLLEQEVAHARAVEALCRRAPRRRCRRASCRARGSDAGA